MTDERAERAPGEHRPVLPGPTLAYLQPRPGGRYVDATVGSGGHAAAVLAASAPDGRLLGLDADPAALEVARAALASFGDRAVLVQANFRDLGAVARARGFVGVQGVLLDLGLSSRQLEASGRGFSFQRDEPLDMRFDPEQPVTAAELLNTLPERELADLFYRYGEEPRSRRLARVVVRRRERRPFQTTGDLVAAVEEALGPRRGRTHPATRVFQALRIAVNDELGALEAALPQAVELLAPGGRLVVISFHSLEDRIVKQFLRAAAAGERPRLAVLTQRPIVADAAELAANPRARSAKLRAAARLEAG